jgi:hypothetical protein
MPRQRIIRLGLSLAVALGAACSSGSGGGATTTPPGSTYTISGTIAGLAGAPIDVALSGASSAITSTDGAGRFAFDGLPNGTYTLTPSGAGWTFSPGSRNVSVSGASRGSQDFAASPASSGGTHRISGTVHGSAVAGVTITLDGDFSATTATSALGAYAFDGLADGAYVLTPSLRGSVFTPASRTLDLTGADVPGQDFTSAPDPFMAGCSISFGAPVNATLGCTIQSIHYTAVYLGALWQIGITTDSADAVHSILELQADSVPALPATVGLGDATVFSAYMQVVWADGGMQWLGGKGQNTIGSMSASVSSESNATTTGLGTAYRPHGTLTATLEPALGATAPLSVTASF